MGLIKGVEKIVKAEGFDLQNLKGVGKALNDAGILKSKIKLVAVSAAALVDTFMRAFESIPEGSEEEKKIPADVIKLYNNFVDVLEDKAVGVTTGETKGPGEAPPKKGKTGGGGRKTSELKVFLGTLIAKGKLDKKAIVAKAKEKFPEATDGAINTYLSDGKNPKYNKFEKLVVVSAEGVFSFKD